MSIVNKLTIALVLALSLTTAIFFTLYKTNLNNYKDLKESVLVERENDKLNYRKYNDSLTAAFVKTQEVNLNTAKTLFKDELDAFKQQTGRNTKNLESLLKTQINGQNTYVFNNISTDSCKSLNLNYKDKFSEIDVTVKDGTAVINSKTKTYLTKYTYNVRKKEPWYKPWKWGKEFRTEILSENPKDSIVQLKEIIIK